MLQEIYEYPRIAIESMYYSYSDGILYGMSWKEMDNDHHVICPGALKFGGSIYFLEKEINVEKEIKQELSENNSYRICFVLQEPQREIEAKTDYCMKFEVLQDKEYKSIEKKAFWYAYIRCSGRKNIELVSGDRAIRYGVPGLIAANDGYKYQLPNRLIRQQLMNDLENKRNKHPLDYLLLRDVYEGKPVSLSFVNMYMDELRQEKIAPDCDPIQAIEQLEWAVKELTFNVVADVAAKEEPEPKEQPFVGGSW